jgi:predicted O-linked N-acetylglucosamine transferase (SPINDLY family)
MQRRNGFRAPPKAKHEERLIKALQNALFFHRQGKLTEAKKLYEYILHQNPRHFDALHLSGVVANQRGLLGEAEVFFQRALNIDQNSASLRLNFGNLLKNTGRFDEALESYDKALSIKPDYAEALHNRGNTLHTLKRFEEALESYAKATHDNDADILFSRGNALHELKRFDESIASYDKALASRPTFQAAYKNRGYSLLNIEHFDEAIKSFDKAISLKHDCPESHNSRGRALYALMKIEAAIASYENALSIKPDYFEAHYNKGIALADLYRLDEALMSFDRATSLKRDFVEVYIKRGKVLADLQRFDEASTSYNVAYALNPDYEFLYGLKLYMQMKHCKWEKLEEELSVLIDMLNLNKSASHPFPVLGLLDHPHLHLVASKRYFSSKVPAQSPRNFSTKALSTGKIRLGYYSSDFRNHPMSHLIVQFLESHNKERFEVHGFAFGPKSTDEIRSRIAKAFDAFHEVSNTSSDELVRLSRKLGIDIAIDLNGYTEHARPDIFGQRCAPIQVSYLGYPGTLGGSSFDYIIADPVVIPHENQAFFTEKVAYLPDSYIVYDTKSVSTKKVWTRPELGLPEQEFVFCCFNSNYKILPSTFDSWIRILKAVDGSVLWLLEDNVTAATNLRKEAERRGVDSHRLIFAPKIRIDEHLARHCCADLFIDTLPYNAHTTAVDALWTGLPVLTLIGRAFAGRVAASLLRAIDMPELITHTAEEYEALAIELARDRQKLGRIRKKLEANRLTRPLFDTHRFTQHIEAAYNAMHKRLQAGLPPDHIWVDPILSSSME